MNDTGTVEVNEEREKALHLQLAFKPGTMADLAVAIVELALKGASRTGQGGIWPDELDFPLLAEDSTCKGSTYHRLATVGILEKDWNQHRTSQAEAANAAARRLRATGRRPGRRGKVKEQLNLFPGQ